MAGTLNVPLLATFNDKGVKDAIKSLATLGGALDGLGKKAAAAFTGYQVLSKSIGFVSSSVNAARDLQRNMAGLTTIFGANTAKMQEFVKTSETMGMSQAQAAKATAFLGSVFKQTGMPMEKVMSQTKRMVSLGADLASTYGYSVEEALTAMTATFRGEYDPIEKFGVAMKQQQVTAELAALGLGKLKGQALIAAQQQVRYNMILQRTADAQGAFARQSGNLFEQQQILQATWTDMQAQLGNSLTPAIGDLIKKITPLISEIVPGLAAGFDSLASGISDSLPSINEIGAGLKNTFDGISGAIKLLMPLASRVIPQIVAHLPEIMTFFAFFKGVQYIGVITESARALALFAAAEGQVAAGAVASSTALVATPWGAIAAGIGLVAAAIVGLTNLSNAGAKTIHATLATVSEAQRRAWLEAGKNPLVEAKKLQDAITRSETAVAGRYDAMAKVEAGRKQTADWLKAAMGMGNTTPTTGGSGVVKLTAAQKAAQAAAKKHAAEMAKAVAKQTADAKKAADDALAVLQKTAEDLKSAYDKMTSDAVSFAQSFNGAVGAFRKLADVPLVLGQFEQQSVDALQSLRDQAKQAFGNGLFGSGITADKALSELYKLVDGQQQAITEIGRQRDVLAKKIDIARQISGSVLSFGNITSALQNIKKDVIETSTQIIDGVTVTISNAVTGINASDLVNEYQKVLDKTKDFAKNLKALKAAGLDSGLFKQIVDAGVDGGGATAAAIVAGGADTINELNSLFADLQSTGSDIAATTTDIMYANGSDIVNGFISGLLSDDSKLALAATNLANTFAETFSNAISNAINAALTAARNAAASAADIANAGGMVNANTMDTYSLARQLAGASPMTNEDIRFASIAQQNNVMVPAPQPVQLVVDGKTLATSLLTYERTNGAIYVRAN